MAARHEKRKRKLVGLGVESFPFGLLTMIVSLEAIFLIAFGVPR